MQSSTICKRVELWVYKIYRSFLCMFNFCVLARHLLH